MPPKKRPAAAPKSSPLLGGRSPIRGVKIGRPASKANAGLEKKLPVSPEPPKKAASKKGFLDRVREASGKRRRKGRSVAPFSRSDFLEGKELPIKKSSQGVILPGDLLHCHAFDNNGVDIGPLVVKTQGSLTWEAESQVDDSGFSVCAEVLGIRDQSQAEPLKQQGGQVGTGSCHICTAWNCQKQISGWHLGQVKWQDPSKVDSIPWGKNVLSGAGEKRRSRDLDPLRHMAQAMGFGGALPKKGKATPAPPMLAAAPPSGSLSPGGGNARGSTKGLGAPAAISPQIKNSGEVSLFLAKQGLLGAVLTNERSKTFRKSAPEKKKKKKKKKKKRGSSSSTSGSSLSSDSGEEALLKLLHKEETSVAELARKHPGMLMARASQQTAEKLDLNYAEAAQEVYLRPVFQRWTREKSGLVEGGPRTEREALTLAKTLDLIIQGRLAEAGDCLVQRLKALSLNHQTQEWGIPNSLELIASEGSQLVEPQEMRASARDHRAATRLLGLSMKSRPAPLPADAGRERRVNWEDRKSRSPTPDRGAPRGTGDRDSGGRQGALRQPRFRPGGRPKGKGKGKKGRKS